MNPRDSKDNRIRWCVRFAQPQADLTTHVFQVPFCGGNADTFGKRWERGGPSDFEKWNLKETPV